MNFCVIHIFISFGKNLEVGSLSYLLGMFNFIRKSQTVFQRDSIILHSHQHDRRVSVAPHPCQYSLSVFLILVILVGVNGHLIVFFICISLMINDVLFAVCFPL